ncbi:beta strand repeat-containing protein [Dactylosporangium sp. CA-139066]|uniref:beta strand repeat-containing protein n=1 Tax=Dactylosporangium sp. CA-139066 TaxID=3239930 RepID=UPI003D91F06E
MLTLVAGGLVATAGAAFAAATLNITHGPSGGGYNIVLTESSAGTFTSAGAASITVQFNSAGTCPGAPATANGFGWSGSAVTGAVQTTVTTPGSGTTLTVPAPATLTLPAAATAPATLSVCAYDGTTLLTAGSIDAGFKLDADVTANPASGASGGGYTVALSSTSSPFTANNSAAHQVQFQAITATVTQCAATAPGAVTPTASNATTMTGGVVAVPATAVQVPAANKMNVTVPAGLAQPANPLVFSANYLICVYNAAGTTLQAETDQSNAFNLQGNTALSTTAGSSAGGNTVTLTAAAPIFTSGVQNVKLEAVADNATCAATWGAVAGTNNVTIPSANVRFVSTSKIAITMPTGSVLPSSTTAFNVCAYGGGASVAAGSPLIAASYGPYTVGQVPTIASVSPATGPAQGGSTITVTGTNFPATGSFTATVGGTPLINPTQVDSSHFTAVVPPHTPGGPFSIAVTTAGGTVTMTGLFTFSNGITVTPKTAPNSSMAPTGIDITGVGFQDLTFNTASSTNGNSQSAHVYLVKGTYSAGTTLSATAVKPNGQTTECIDVLVVGDTELLCNLYLGGNLNPAPTAVTRTLSSCASYPSAVATAPLATPVASAYIGPSSGTVTTCAFTQADVGSKITAGASGAAIADNTTTITAVSAAGVATLSKNSTAALTAATTPISLSSTRTVTDGAITLGSTNLTSTLAPFAASDVNRMITGPGLPYGTYIVSVAGGVATLSNAATSASTAGSFAVFAATPVPNGTYTVTVVSNGEPGAPARTTIPYYQSIISSGSTFTVADYMH